MAQVVDGAQYSLAARFILNPISRHFLKFPEKEKEKVKDQNVTAQDRTGDL